MSIIRRNWGATIVGVRCYRLVIFLDDYSRRYGRLVDFRGKRELARPVIGRLGWIGA